jgi:hypothetical protein
VFGRGASSENTMNIHLVRVHRVIFIIYFSLGTILLAAALIALPQHDGETATGFFGIALLLSPVGIGHFIAAKGAALGKSYGRTMSRVLGTLMFFAVPVGTLIGIFIYTQIGKRWQSEAVVPL